MQSNGANSWPDFGATAGCSIFWQFQTPEALKPVMWMTFWLLNPLSTILCVAELNIGCSTGDWIALLCNKSEDRSHRSRGDLPTWTLKWLREVSIISLPKGVNGCECIQWAVFPNNKLLQFSTTNLCLLFSRVHVLAWLVFRWWLPLHFKYLLVSINRLQ